MFNFEETMRQIKTRMDQGEELFLLDVREDDEFLEGHIPGATHIPLNEILESTITVAKDCELYVYCRSGQRSAAACRKLHTMGYTNVVNAGGIIHWKWEQEGNTHE